MFDRFFDCLILDEVDAFPYKGNEVLNHLIKRSVKGHIVYLSATISSMRNVKTLYLNRRFHNKDIPIPIARITFFKKRRLIKDINLLLSLNRYILIFVSSIKRGEEVFNLLKKKYQNIVFINSKTENRNKVFNQIRDYNYRIIVTTTIMERGITLKNVSVIVYEAENSIFDESTLLQIVGRVGRKVGFENGEIYFISKYKMKKYKTVIKRIKQLNESL